MEGPSGDHLIQPPCLKRCQLGRTGCSGIYTHWGGSPYPSLLQIKQSHFSQLFPAWKMFQSSNQLSIHLLPLLLNYTCGSLIQRSPDLDTARGVLFVLRGEVTFLDPLAVLLLKQAVICLPQGCILSKMLLQLTWSTTVNKDTNFFNHGSKPNRTRQSFSLNNSVSNNKIHISQTGHRDNECIKFINFFT